MIQQGSSNGSFLGVAQQDGRPGNLNTTTGQFTPFAPLPSPRFHRRRGRPQQNHRRMGSADTGHPRPTPSTRALGRQRFWGRRSFPDAAVPAEAPYRTWRPPDGTRTSAAHWVGYATRRPTTFACRAQPAKTANTGTGARTRGGDPSVPAVQRTANVFARTTGNSLDGPACDPDVSKLGLAGATSQGKHGVSSNQAVRAGIRPGHKC